MNLGVLDRERVIHQAVAEPGQPLFAGQHETQRAHAGEVIGQQAAQRPGIIALLGGGPALHQVENAVWNCHR